MKDVIISAIANYTSDKIKPYIESINNCGLKGKPELESVLSTIEGQPRFKFAGGWFTCLSGDLEIEEKDLMQYVVRISGNQIYN